MRTKFQTILISSLVLAGAIACDQPVQFGANEAEARGEEPPTSPPPPAPSCQLERCYEDSSPAAFGYTVEAISYNGHPAIEVQGGHGPGARFESSGGEGLYVQSHSQNHPALYAHHAFNAINQYGYAVKATVASPDGVPAKLVNLGGGDIMRGYKDDGTLVIRIANDGRLYGAGGIEQGKTGHQGSKGPTGETGDAGSVGNPGSPGKTSGNFWCGQANNCNNKCNGVLVGAQQGECYIGGSNGYSYGGVDGVCCACS